jgi:hypothetical protein
MGVAMLPVLQKKSVSFSPNIVGARPSVMFITPRSFFQRPYLAVQRVLRDNGSDAGMTPLPAPAPMPAPPRRKPRRHRAPLACALFGMGGHSPGAADARAGFLIRVWGAAWLCCPVQSGEAKGMRPTDIAKTLRTGRASVYMAR